MNLLMHPYCVIEQKKIFFKEWQISCCLALRKGNVEKTPMGTMPWKLHFTFVSNQQNTFDCEVQTWNVCFLVYLHIQFQHVVPCNLRVLLVLNYLLENQLEEFLRQVAYFKKIASH